jgi:thiosulfate dehydrogenase
MNRAIVARCGLAIFLISAFAILLSGRTNSFASQNSPKTADSSSEWKAPDPATIPQGPLGDSIRLGLDIFNETPKNASAYVGNMMSCGDCHIQSGTVAGASPMVGLPGLFPMYRDREKTVVTFEERIEQCFQRSESGHRLPNNSPEMVGLVAYAQWLSKDQATGQPFPGRGLVKLPELTGDPDQGALLYKQQCALCHRPDGAGTPPGVPALWGPDAYSAGAGMNDIAKMAAFVQHNMPMTNPGSLTPQQSYDIAAYVHSKPHEPFNIKDHQ